MAVKVHCSICEKFIKNVEQYDFQKLTGEEICKKCGDRVSKVYGELDGLIGESTKEIEEYYEGGILKYLSKKPIIKGDYEP